MQRDFDVMLAMFVGRSLITLILEDLVIRFFCGLVSDVYSLP